MTSPPRDSRAQSAPHDVRVVDGVRESEARVRALELEVWRERQIAELARRFMNLSLDDFEPTLDAGLEEAALVADAGRAQLTLLEQGKVTFQHMWTAPAYRDSGDSGDSVPAADLRDLARCSWAAQQLASGRALHVPSVAGLPAEAKAERESFAALGTRSYLAFPLGEPGALLGFVDFSRFDAERPWSAAEIDRMRLVVEVLAGALARLRAERERREAEERLRTLASCAQDTLCELTEDGRLLYLSENVVQLLGYPRAELDAESGARLVHPDDFEALKRGVLGAASSGAGRQLTFRVRHRDGDWRWLEATVNPFEASGEQRLAVVLRDVTDRHTQRLELEHELEIEKQVADFSRELLEISADGIDAGIQYGLGVAAQVAGAGRAFLMSAQSEGSPDTQLHRWAAIGVDPNSYAWDPHSALQRWVRERLVAGEVVRVPDRSAIPVESARRDFDASPVQSFLCIPIFAGPRLMGVLGFHCLASPRGWSDREVALLRLVADLFTSALRRKQAEVGLVESQRRLLQAQKMEAVGTLAGGIAHDFNNQLTVMLSNARYVLQEAPPGSEMHQALDDLTRAAEHCAQLTRSLLAFSRRTPAAPTPLEVGAVLTEAEELLRPLIPSSIRLRVQVDDASARISADPTQLQQVLVNLVVNARDAMVPDGGRLDVIAGVRDLSGLEADQLGLPAAGSYAELAVRDNGAGMDEDLRARVFEPFFTTKPLGEGTGLGLATAYGIVEQCRGAIAVESEPGRGSTFRVLLPLCGEDDEDVAGPESLRSHAGPGTVLLAEDEAGVRRILARTLREAGYRVIEAQDGVEALRLGRQQLDAVDAVVTDVEMPRLSGIDLARRLARHRPELPVLFISGSSPEQLGIRGLDASDGPLHFLGKPFSGQRLLERVEDLVDRSGG